MKRLAFLAALLLPVPVEAHSPGDPDNAVLTAPAPPPGSPRPLLPGSSVRLEAGIGVLRQIAALEGSRLDVEVRGRGPVGVVLYDSDGLPLVSKDGTDLVRVGIIVPRDGIYYMAPLGTAGQPLEVSLSMAPPPAPTEPEWKAAVTKLAVEKTAFGDARLIPTDEIVSGNFAQATMSPFDLDRPSVLYRFEGRQGQRVKVTVRSREVHSLVRIERLPADPEVLRSSDSQYRGDVGLDSVVDRYLPANGSYFIVVQAFAKGSRGERDVQRSSPDLGGFTVELSLR